MADETNVALLPGMNYGYGKALDLSFTEVLARTRDALKTEGFGVLCEIDIREKFKEKLGVDFRNYVILGACNPPIAFQTLQAEINVGLLLPCNVVVYEEKGRTVVAAVDAGKLVAVTGNPDLVGAAEQVTQKLRRVIDRV